MIAFFDNGVQIRGDAIRTFLVRYQLAPVPVTLELTVVSDAETSHQLKQGKTITLGGGDVFEIIKVEDAALGNMEGERIASAVRVTCFLQACARVAFVRDRAIIKEATTLAEIYRAAGGSVRVDGDFSIDRFSCFVGDTPTFAIQKALQEQGGTVFWRDGKLLFRRYRELFEQKPFRLWSDLGSKRQESGFLERHQVPNTFSTDDTGAVIWGEKAKARSARFSPNKTPVHLNNLSLSLVHRQPVKTRYDVRLMAGQLHQVGDTKLVVVSALHAVDQKQDGASQHTKLWLASLES